MSIIPFAITDDLSQTSVAGKIPKADASGKIASGFSPLTVPSGATAFYGFITSPLPTLPSNIFAIGKDTTTDQIMLWDGTKWRSAFG